MATGRRDFERPLGAFLAFHIRKIGKQARLLRPRGLGRGEHLAALEMIDQRQQCARRQHIEIPGPGGFRANLFRTDDANPARDRPEGRGQYPGDFRQLPVQRQFAKHQISGDFLRRKHPHLHQDPDGDRQIVVTAFLDDVGRGKIDGDALWRQGKTKRTQRRPDPVLALVHGLGRKADDGKGGQPVAHMHLNIDIEGIHPLKRHCPNPRNHIRPTENVSRLVMGRSDLFSGGMPSRSSLRAMPDRHRAHQGKSRTGPPLR